MVSQRYIAGPQPRGCLGLTVVARISREARWQRQAQRQVRRGRLAGQRVVLGP